MEMKGKAKKNRINVETGVVGMLCAGCGGLNLPVSYRKIGKEWYCMNCTGETVDDR